MNQTLITLIVILIVICGLIALKKFLDIICEIIMEE